MIRRALLFPAIVAAFIAMLVAHPRAQFNGCPPGFCQPTISVVPAVPPTIDGFGTNIGGSNSLTTSLTTTQSNDKVVVFVSMNGCTTNIDTLAVTAVGLTFGSVRGSNNFGGSTNCAGNLIAEFTALAASASTFSIVATIAPGASVSYMETCTFGVHGTNTSSPFDANGSLPGAAGNTTFGPTLSLSTSHATDLVYAGFRNWVSNDASWTTIGVGSFIGCESKPVTSIQSGLSPLAGNANLSGNSGAVGDAMVSP